MQIIIPMSGLGQRFVNAGYSTPKPLIIVDDLPIIQHVINLFPNETNISFICNDDHLANTNMRKILKTICPSCNIYEVSVKERQGPVHAVSLIYDTINNEDEVIVSYCDYGTDWDYEHFLKDTRERNADGAIACYKGFHPHMLGTDNYAFLKETEYGSRWMEQIQEKKPFTDDKMSEYASNGTYYFKSGAIMKQYFKKLMDLKQKVNNEYYVSMVYNLMVNDTLKVNIFEINHMLQWGTPNDLEIYINWSNYFKKLMDVQPSFIDKLNTTLILPMAGAGSRFSQNGYTVPKPLIDVNGLPMIIQAVNCLPMTSQQVFICQKEHIDNYPLSQTISKYCENPNIITINGITGGQACTTEIGLENINLNNPILISACDNGVYYDKNKYNTLLEDESIDIIVWTFKNEPTSKLNPHMYAWLETTDDDFVTNVSRKKFNDNVHDLKNSHVIIGTMFYRKGSQFVDGLHMNYDNKIKTNGEYYVDDVINQNIKSGLKVKAFQVEHYICWGTPNDYETYNYWNTFFNKCPIHPYKINTV